MNLVLRNIDSALLPVLESFKGICPNLQIVKEQLVYSDEEIKGRLQSEIEKIEKGEGGGYTLEQIRAEYK